MLNNHMDADDVAQQVWIKVWNKLDGFKMESEFSTWLFRIAYNETLNYAITEAHDPGSTFKLVSKCSRLSLISSKEVFTVGKDKS